MRLLSIGACAWKNVAAWFCDEPVTSVPASADFVSADGSTT